MNAEGKKLYRSSKNSMIAGVCGGMAEYMGLDPTAVRVATIILFFLTAAVPISAAYVVAWMVMPAPPGPMLDAPAESPQLEPEVPAPDPAHAAD